MRNDYQQTVAQEQSLSSALEQQKSDALALKAFNMIGNGGRFDSLRGFA